MIALRYLLNQVENVILHDQHAGSSILKQHIRSSSKSYTYAHNIIIIVIRGCQPFPTDIEHLLYYRVSVTIGVFFLLCFYCY